MHLGSISGPVVDAEKQLGSALNCEDFAAKARLVPQQRVCPSETAQQLAETLLLVSGQMYEN